jgi:hypothetical protein
VVLLISISLRMHTQSKEPPMAHNGLIAHSFFSVGMHKRRVVPTADLRQKVSTACCLPLPSSRFRDCRHWFEIVVSGRWRKGSHAQASIMRPIGMLKRSDDTITTNLHLHAALALSKILSTPITRRGLMGKARLSIADL